MLGGCPELRRRMVREHPRAFPLGQAIRYHQDVEITKRDLLCAAAYKEFVGIADSDIRAAHSEVAVRRTPSESALDVYGDVVTQAEAQADVDADLFESN